MARGLPALGAALLPYPAPAADDYAVDLRFPVRSGHILIVGPFNTIKRSDVDVGRLNGLNSDLERALREQTTENAELRRKMESLIRESDSLRRDLDGLKRRVDDLERKARR